MLRVGQILSMLCAHDGELIESKPEMPRHYCMVGVCFALPPPADQPEIVSALSEISFNAQGSG